MPERISDRVLREMAQDRAHQRQLEQAGTLVIENDGEKVLTAFDELKSKKPTTGARGSKPRSIMLGGLKICLHPRRGKTEGREFVFGGDVELVRFSTSELCLTQYDDQKVPRAVKILSLVYLNGYWRLKREMGFVEAGVAGHRRIGRGPDKSF